MSFPKTKSTSRANAQRQYRPSLLALAIAAASFGAGHLPEAAAAKNVPSTNQAQSVQQNFYISPGSLSAVLNRFASAAGITLSFDPARLEGVDSRGIRGNYSVDEALRYLLSGTGMQASRTGGGAYVIAAASGNDSAMTLPPVLVSGEKIERELANTLSSVAVMTGDEIRDHADIDLQNLMFRTPGVYSQSGNENWGIRGVPVSGFDEQGAGTMNGAVTVFVDGAAQPHRLVTLNPLNLWDVEQVEVFRGAQSTTQGRNSLAGAVVLNTKDPTYEPALALQANAGKYGEWGASGVVNGALVDGKVAGRLAVDYRENDGYIRNETLGIDADERRNFNARGKLLFEPGEDLDILLTLARTELRQGSYTVSAVDGRPLYFSQFLNTPEKDDMDQDSAILEIDYRLSDAWTLTSLTTGTWAEYRALLDFDQGPDREREAVRKHKQKLANQEFRLNYETDGLSGFLGVYHGTHTNDIDDRINLKLAGIDDPALVAAGDVEIRNTAIFGELNWEFVDHWQLIAGLRYDREKNDTEFNYTDPLGFATVPSASVDTTFNEWLPKVGISHQLSDNHLVGLTWKRGYRGGGIDLSTSTAHAPYDPEFTNTWELAWRGTWLDGRLRTTANLFHTDWKDQQVEVSDENGIATVANASEARLQGLEFSVDYRATSALDLYVEASYSDTEYKTFVFDGQDLSGQQFPFSPEYKLAVGGLYTFANGLRVGTDVIHQDDSVTLAVNDDDLLVERPNERITLVNLTVEHPVSRSVTLSGYVKNLFDKEYIVNNQDDLTLDVGAPRTFGVSVRYDL